MSKIHLIEKKLLAINGDRFQDFCNDYFFYIGHHFLTTTGSVIAKQKSRKGTPDCYIPCDDGYIFVEYTTKERLGKAKSFFKKLSKDVDDCFNESKINNNQIKKVILCFTEELKVHEDNELRKKCISFGAEFKPYGIDQLARAVLLYPALAQYLDLEIDTGQILSPNDFIKEYEKGKLSTTLSNKMFFIEDELKRALFNLESYDLLIIEGNAGVGKSRFALEVQNEFFNKNPNFIPFCITNKGCPVYEDIRTFLQKDRDYLLFIDDANRASKHYEFILNLLKEERTGIVKIIITVRDYALNQIEDSSSNFDYKKIKLSPLNDKEIRKLLQSDDFKIRNQKYLDFIVDIANGNPRLAIMAAKLALEKRSLTVFKDVFKIYEAYFERVIKDIEEFKDINYLKVLGLISFFRIIGKEYAVKQKILDVFKIQENEFWEKTIMLHQMELVDLYENEIVKTSDQILSSYIFYKVFILDGILDFHQLITHFFEENHNKFNDSIYGVVNTFGFKPIKEKIQNSLNSAWQYFEKDELLLQNFMRIFGFFQQEKVLNYVEKSIGKLPIEPFEVEKINKTENDLTNYPNSAPYNYFSLLKPLLFVSSPDFELTLTLTFQYFEKQPFHLNKFIAYAASFEMHDAKSDFCKQITLVEMLLSEIQNSNHPEMFKYIFCSISNSYLQTAFQLATPNRDRSLTNNVYSFEINSTLKEIREKIWTFLFEEFEKDRTLIFNIFSYHVTYKNNFTAQVDKKQEFWNYDAQFLIPFIKANFNTESYKECKIALQYLEELAKLNIEFDINLMDHFTSDIIKLAQTLNYDIIYGTKRFDRPEYEEIKLGVDAWEAVNNIKEEELKEFVNDFDLEDYKKLCVNIKEIWDYEDKGIIHIITVSFHKTLHIVEKENVEIFLKLIEYIYKNIELPVNFTKNYSGCLTFDALKSLQKNHLKLFKTIAKFNEKDKLLWKSKFFINLYEKYIDRFYAEELIKFVKRIEREFSFFTFDFLSKYQTKLPEKIRDKNIVLTVVSILLKKVEKEEVKIFFGPYFISENISHFSNDFGTLIKVYLENYYYENNNYRYDHQDEEIKVLFDKIPDCLDRLIDKLGLRKFKFVWEYDYYSSYVDKIIDYAKTKENSFGFYQLESQINYFFNFRVDVEQKRKKDYLKSYIERNSNDNKGIRLVFNTIIVDKFKEHLLEFLKIFLQHNQSIDLFKSFNFFKRIEMYSGSRIPIIEEKIEFINQVKELLNSFPNSKNYIKHKLFIKNKIQQLREDIKRTRKREFEDFY